jgi:hypothetical protein
MKKKFIIIVLLIITSTIKGQEEIGKFVLDLKQNNSGIKDVFPVINDKTGNYVLFVSDSKNVYAYKFNNSFKVIGKIISEKKKKKFSDFLGYSISDKGDYTLYMQNKNFKTEFLQINFSFDLNTSESSNFRLDKGTQQIKETFVKALSHNNKFYIISVLYEEKGFFLREIDGENVNFYTIGENIEGFLSKRNKKSNIRKIFYENRNNVSIVEEGLPNSIEMVAEPIKIYKRKKSLTFTFDQNPLQTQILKINLADFSEDFSLFNKPMKTSKERKKTNSFIYGENILLITVIYNGVQAYIYNTITNKEERSFVVYGKKTIEFKNSPIIQEGGMYNNYREIDGTNNFLRKLNSGKVGISLRKLSENLFQMNIGGYKEQKRGGAMPMPGFGGLPVAGFGSFSLAINPTQFAFNSYSNTKSIRIECLLDSKFNSIRGEVPENIFDKINTYEEGIKSKLNYEEEEDEYGVSTSNFSDGGVQDLNSNGNIIFKYDGYFVKTFYNKANKEFTFRKFIE